MMAVDVAVMRRFPRESGIFTYSVTHGDAPKEGAFVSVPFRGRQERGVVLGPAATIRKTPLKAVTSVDTDALTQSEIAFYRALAQRTVESLGTILNAAIPIVPKRSGVTHMHDYPAIHPRVSRADVPQIQALVDACRATRAVVSVPSHAMQETVVASLMRTRNAPMLLLVAHAHLRQSLAAMAASCGNVVHICGGETAKTAAYAAWRALREGQDAITVATRSGALIVPSRDTHIVVMDSGSDDHRSWDQRPKFDARWCATTLHTLQGNRLTLLDVLPRVEEGVVSYDGWRPYAGVQLVQFSSCAAATPWFLTEPMKDALAQTPPRARVIVYHNRLGDGSSLMCRACGYSPSCATCRVPLVPSAGGLSCRVCGMVETIPAACSQCQASAFLTRGLGVERLARALSQVIRDDRPVHIVRARDPLPSHGILVATDTLFSRPIDPETVGGVFIPLADHLFFAHDFRSYERARRTVRALVGLARDARAPFVAQAWQTELVSSALGPTEPLMRQENAWRHALHFPPASTLVTIRERTTAQEETLRDPSPQQSAELLTLPSSFDIIVD